ncbi:hypothetical protein [Macrococcus capreoli]|uniref:hypothetical protein n=1 Tax=Macrococcus capreoli TaxID=2982690 RepID=UPI0021D5F1E3|nr:hypothetical protein [Macrococcus sp. TMW 2.2395]MCU7557249.1 hypothetical protein [Macrococcus sp. TMW 2.2395]
MPKLAFYNENNIVAMLLENVIDYSEKKDEFGLKDYSVNILDSGVFEMKGSIFNIAFFDDSVSINEGQDISDLLSDKKDNSEFINTELSKDEEIAELKKKVETLEGAIVELLETLL